MNQNETEMRSRYAIDVQKLAEFLDEMQSGDEITYRELSKHIGINVQKEGYQALARARQILSCKRIQDFD